ncbi:TPA: hypothetical protein EYN23_26220 [Candidatus Poribacteria bacterium]|nr:hypothetical protein [Candidatus Poribacteria bacterium]
MSIVSLGRKSAEDNTTVAGNTVTADQSWIMRLSAPASTVTAYNQVDASGSSFGFPDRGSGHDDLDSLKMIDYDVSHKDGQQDLFTVTVNYSNEREVIDTNTATNPLDLPISYSYDQIDLMAVVLEDQVTGDLIENFLGKPPASPFIENEPLTRITITKNERQYNNDRAEEIRNTVNQQAQRINGRVYPAGQLKLERFTGSNQFDQDAREYFVVTYQILVNKKGFKRKLLQRSTVNTFGQSPADIVIHDDGAAYIDEDGTFRDPTAEPRGLTTEFNTLEVKQWSLRL